jgi:hypothetical protein
LHQTNATSTTNPKLESLMNFPPLLTRPTNRNEPTTIQHMQNTITFVSVNQTILHLETKLAKNTLPQNLKIMQNITKRFRRTRKMQRPNFFT